VARNWGLEILLQHVCDELPPKLRVPGSLRNLVAVCCDVIVFGCANCEASGGESAVVVGVGGDRLVSVPTIPGCGAFAACCVACFVVPRLLSSTRGGEGNEFGDGGVNVGAEGGSEGVDMRVREV
jgi:hypothetical protein